jgi:hypothetical protein
LLKRGVLNNIVPGIGSQSARYGTMKGASSAESATSFVQKAVLESEKTVTLTPTCFIARDAAFAPASAGQKL